MSCDRTSDIAYYFVKSFKMFCNNFSFPIYFGVNENIENANELKAIAVKSVPSNWRDETIYQLKVIKDSNPSLTHLVVLLDDFIFLKPCHFSLYNLIVESVEKKIKYLRFKPIEEGVFKRIYNKFKKRSDFKTARIIEVRKSHPYYSSLQVALWNVDYLIEMVANSTSIWDFENQHSSTTHFSTCEDYMFYEHIVEKGEWDLNAKNICIKYFGSFNPGKRKVRSVSLTKRIRIYIQKFSFFLLGYYFLRLRNKSEI